ncbi:MAG: 23S rRNA (uracil(1939)-C(5))-methyltransferase RlmD, partial [Deltaproteobacteria bacterium]
VAAEFQAEAKQNLVRQALFRIGRFDSPPVSPTIAAPDPFHYRNKAIYPLAWRDGRVKAGYYRKGTHTIVNLNRCPIQDPRLDPFLAEVKHDLGRWPIYDEATHRGEVRHLCVRVGRRTGEVLLTLVCRRGKLPGLAAQAGRWMRRYPSLVGVCLNRQPARGNVIFGPETRCVAGRPFIHEVFAGLRLRIYAETFFQVHTEQAEEIVRVIEQRLGLTGAETLLDAYCGIGTLTLPLARHVRLAVGIEASGASIEAARENAEANGIHSVRFVTGRVESVLPELDLSPEIVLLDPPRKGCAPPVIETLRRNRPERIVYVSCNPATLARDLHHLCAGGAFTLEGVQPIDLFPQTHHIESVAFLRRSPATGS